MIEAQRWPADFDGIVAMAPAIQLQSLFLGFTRNNKLIFTPGGNLTPAKLVTLNRAILAACDAQDGANDSILSQPKLCTFNPAALRCTGADGDACRTGPADHDRFFAVRHVVNQWQAVPPGLLPRKRGGVERDADGRRHGSDAALQQLVRRPVRALLRHPESRCVSFHVRPSAVAAADHELSLLSDSDNPNLAAFRARGGKLILYHGLADSAISPKDTEAYYQAVVTAAGGQAEADKFVKAFFNPGVGHCTGGPGADTVDLLTPVMNWVESGTDPTTTGITVTKVAQGATVLSRPLCPYPQYPRYKGTGALTDAGSFVCTQP